MGILPMEGRNKGKGPHWKSLHRLLAKYFTVQQQWLMAGAKITALH